MFNVIKKTIVSYLLIFVLAFCSVTPVFANTPINGDDVSLLVVNDNRYIVLDNGNKSFIDRVSTKDTVTYSVKDNSNGESYYFVRNLTNNTIYSSITGKTISVDDNNVEKSSTASYKYISYKSLLNGLGKVATVAAIITLLISYFGLYAVLSNVTGWVSTSLSIINSNLPKGASNHGLKIKIENRVIQKHQGGKIINVTVKYGTGISFY